LLFLTVLGIASIKSSHDLAAARQRKLTLETRIQATEGEIDHLRNRIERLKSDPGLLERLAREDLGMVRPGDVVIELPMAGAEGAALPPAVVTAPSLPAPGPGAGSTAKASSAPTVPPAVPATAPSPETLEHP